MYRNGGSSSSRIGRGNYRTNSSYGNRRHPVNDWSPSSEYDRSSPNADYTGSPPRDVDYQNDNRQNPRYNNDRGRPQSAARNYDDEYPGVRDASDRNERYSSNDDYGRYSDSQDPHYNDSWLSSSRNDRRPDDVRNFRHSREQDVSHRYLSDDDNDRSQPRSRNSRMTQDPYYYNTRQASYSPEYDRNIRNYDHPRGQDFSHPNDRYLSDDDNYRSPSRAGNTRDTHTQDPYYHNNRQGSYSPEVDRNIRNRDHPRDQDLSHSNDRYLSYDHYDSSFRGRNDSRTVHGQDQRYDDHRRSTSQPEYDRNVRNHDDDRQTNHTNTRSSPNDDYDRDRPRHADFENPHYQESQFYDSRRTSYSPRSDRKYHEERRSCGPRATNYDNERVNRTNRSPSNSRYSRNDFDNRMPAQSDRHSSNSEQLQTSPPRWFIDGEPATFAEYQRHQVKLKRQANYRKPCNYFPDYDEEQEFGKLTNKMKIGQRDREKLAEEMGFNDPPPPPRRRRGGRGYHH
ncbi:hypothetical protein CAEBREN_26061 [Caenorhabditis brenneri]|uniref:Uncharacterized protein n=1 Tax=Caenorhabditis brenneri TaxID=135651 RepID=G0ND91_CAEBE|nr:hypothetical protein CAEBREN_26061 [Caenorhabditis brenneri]